MCIGRIGIVCRIREKTIRDYPKLGFIKAHNMGENALVHFIKEENYTFILADNEPVGHAGMSIWRLLRETNTL